jgi:hypothetical protein
MLKKIMTLAAVAVLTALLLPSRVAAWGAAHVGVTRVGPGGVYHAGRTVAAGPRGVYAGGRSYGAGAYGGYRAGYGGAVGYRGGYAGGYRYGGYAGGYRYGGYSYGAARYGWIR